jgi:hypothetical protein
MVKKRLSRSMSERYRGSTFRNEAYAYCRKDRQEVRRALLEVIRDPEKGEGFSLPERRRPWYHRHDRGPSWGFCTKVLAAQADRDWPAVRAWIDRNFDGIHKRDILGFIGVENDVDNCPYPFVSRPAYYIDHDNIFRRNRKAFMRWAQLRLERELAEGIGE